MQAKSILYALKLNIEVTHINRAFTDKPQNLNATVTSLLQAGTE
jgi:hypothetical protein